MSGATQRTVQREAARIEQELKARWPSIITEVRLETPDEEDAYVYIATPENVEEDVMLDMIDLTIELYERAGIYITGRINWGHPLPGVSV